jgi:hypothetical protein
VSQVLPGTARSGVLGELRGLGSIAHPYAQEVALSPRVVSAAEWVPAGKELQATEEEAVRALWQIADDTGR